MASSTMRKIFERSTEAFNRHDIDAFKANLADDVTITAPGGLHLQGREAVSSFYKSWMDGFPDAHVDVRGMHETNDCVIEEGTFSGTHRGVMRTPDGDIPPTGRSVNARYMELVRIRGEQIASFDLIYERLEMMEQLGLTGSASRGEMRQGGDTGYVPAPH